MANDCSDPGALMAIPGVSCYQDLSQIQRDAIKTYLLAFISERSTETPAQLAEAAKEFTCLEPKQLQAIQAYLLCRLVGG